MGAARVLPMMPRAERRLAVYGSVLVLALALAGQVRAADGSEELPMPTTPLPPQSVTPEEELLGRIQGMGPVRIVMHSLEPADRLAGQLSSLLAALGLSQIEQRIVEAVPESNQVRYYHSADRQAGQVVGDALGLVFDEVAVRDFQGYQPVPSEGLIEVWLR